MILALINVKNLFFEASRDNKYSKMKLEAGKHKNVSENILMTIWIPH